MKPARLVLKPSPPPLRLSKEGESPHGKRWQLILQASIPFSGGPASQRNCSVFIATTTRLASETLLPVLLLRGPL